MNFCHIKTGIAQNKNMKTYEWIIKLISYILCLSAVCAGFALKEQAANDKLESYIRYSADNKTSQLCDILIRLKSGLSRCVSDEADNESFAEVGYCCKAASDAVCEADGSKNSEALRMFFDRVKKVCDSVYGNNEKTTLSQRQMISELYMRLSAQEEALLSGQMSASELISALSVGLQSKSASKNAAKLDRISINRAEKYAYELIGVGVRLKNSGIFDGHFIFASESSCIVLSKKGAPLIKSRTVTIGTEHMDLENAGKIAEDHVFGLTGKPCKAVLNNKVFGIYYFSVLCDKKEYPVGVDKTDGSIVFYVVTS